MAKTAACPSCGAPVTFRSVASVTAVCDFCQSTLVRHGEDIDDIGKRAAFLEDRSPLQRGSEGRWQGRSFGLIGRLQLRYADGSWNEWHLLFDDGKSGWLSESGGELVLSEPMRVPEALPQFGQLAVGEAITLNGRSFEVTNILEAECVALEGELPFKIGSGYPAPVVDLRDSAGGFATLDYSDAPEDPAARPLVFIGTAVTQDALSMRHLREPDALPTINAQARAFQCPSCGGALSASGDDILSVGCGNCGAIVDPTHATVKLLAKVKAQQTVKPPLELGTTGVLRGEKLQLIGAMRRKMKADGQWYFWWELVALAPDRSLRWLTEYDGHWNLARVQNKAIANLGQKLKFGKDEYKHFQTYEALVDFVLGEFPWQVRVDEKVKVHDYVAPPFMLSREVSDKESTWTLAEYIEPDEIAGAFLPKSSTRPDTPARQLRQPKGVFANQPNPREAIHRSVCRSFWVFFVLAWIIHIALLAGAPDPLLTERQSFAGNADEPRVSREFELPQGSPRLEISHETQLYNNWVGLHLNLINKTTGQAWTVDREISYYAGVDGGESWSEGSRGDEIIFTDLPPGTYVLASDAEMDAGTPQVDAELRISPSGPRWSSLFLLLGLLVAFPIWTRLRKAGFEVARWAESDHPIVTSGDDDDD